MLESVEKPTEGSGPLAQGVMVTPDGGYVIARPDLWVKFALENVYSFHLIGLNGKNNGRDQKS
jgi:hypothetical protein